MKITSAVFDSSAAALAACPVQSLPEFAFIGRSNVGKSTLVNRIAEKRELARVSDTPGFTKTINFFTVNRRWRLVDLPGYGFAKASQQQRASYAGLIEDYLLHRESLVCVFLLVDASISPQAQDLDFVHWIGEASRPFSIVFTKMDKAKGNKALEHVEAFVQTVSPWFEDSPLTFSVSAKKQDGIRALQEFIDGSASAVLDSSARVV